MDQNPPVRPGGRLRPGQSRWATFAAAALLGSAGLATAATPALAWGGSLVASSNASLANLPTAGGGPAVGAASQVDLAGLPGADHRSWPAISPAGALRRTASAQAGAADGAYTALAPIRLLDTRTDGGTLGSGDVLNLTVTGGNVPSSATAVALNVTVTDTTASSYLSLYPAGVSRPLLSNLNWIGGETVANLVIVPVGSGGEVTIFNYQGHTDVLVDLEGYFAPEVSGSTAGSYVPLPPARILDTRAGSGDPGAGQPLAGGSSLDVQVAGLGGVPESGVAAVLLNVTAVDTSADSYLSVFPQGGSVPLASNLNWVKGAVVANRVMAAVNPATGEVTLFNHLGTTDVVVDVSGYFTTGSTTPSGASLFSPITPVRLLDTRLTGVTLGAGATVSQQVAGSDGISTSASALVGNVTAVDTTASSYLTVYPGGIRPVTSDVNWMAGQTVPNLTLATLSGTGALYVYNYAGKADVVIDAFGYFSPEATSTALTVTTVSLPVAEEGSAYSASLAASGGTAPYSWALTSGSLPAGLSLASSGVISGTPTAAGSASFGVQVTDSSLPAAATATAELALAVELAAPPTTYSSDWSGYFLGSGPYTGVSGTFNVPAIYSSNSYTDTAEWVGIDGATNTDLIQAGIDEPYDPYTNTYAIQAWWEILPAPATPITMAVAPGDSVTVTISQLSGTNWAITVADNTSSASFTIDQSYNGPLTSADWIVEAPTDNGSLSTLGGYSPDVTFRDLRFIGPQDTMTAVTMVQNGVVVSTPSVTDAVGFNVAYGGSVPAPP